MFKLVLTVITDVVEGVLLCLRSGSHAVEASLTRGNSGVDLKF